MKYTGKELANDILIGIALPQVIMITLFNVIVNIVTSIVWYVFQEGVKVYEVYNKKITRIMNTYPTKDNE